MRTLKFFYLLFIGLIISSCSSDSEETAKQLFANVPADADVVALCNIKKVIGHSGAEVKDGKVEDASKLTDLISLNDADLKKKIQRLFSEDSGFGYDMAVYFLKGGQPTIITLLSDPEKFKTVLLKEVPGDWNVVKNGKLTIYEKEGFGIVEDKLFISRAITADQIARLMTLSEVESFNSVDYAEKMAKSDDDVTLWSSIDGLFDASGLGFAKKTQARMALGMFFNNPKYIVGSADLKKDELELEFEILDNTLKPSKCELKLSKIDVANVAALGGNADVIGGVAISEKLVEQLLNVASSAGGALPKAYSDLLSPIDGTIAIAASTDTSNPMYIMNAGYRASIATNGKQNAQLAQALQALGTVSIDGNLINVSKGAYGNGSMDVKETAQKFKDAWLGVAFNISQEKLPGVKNIIITAQPSDGSLNLKVTIPFKL